MYSLLLITHGYLADEMKKSLYALCYLKIEVHTICINEETLVCDYIDMIREKIIQLMDKGEVIVLTDVKLGTPFNIVMQLMKDYDFYHLTGINIPLLMKLNDTYCLTAKDAIEKSLWYAKEELMDTESIKRRALYEIVDEE